MKIWGNRQAVVWLALWVSSLALGFASAAEPNLENWVKTQTQTALDRLYLAISPADGALGSVMASPSRSQPDYYFHWVRDSALVMREVWAYRALRPELARRTLMDYALFSRRNQATENLSGAAYGEGLGEPKFEMSGEAFTGDWGRPQNDGPALRVLALLGLADDLMQTGQSEFVYRNLYASEMPARTVIKADLEFVARHWPDPSFDLWEEVKGDHFYTRIAQWRALEEGSIFARKMGDPEAAVYYHGQATRVLESLDRFWSTSKNYLVATRNWAGGHDSSEKPSLLDVSIILGVLHSGKSGFPFYVDDDRVIATLDETIRVFDNVFPVNRVRKNSEGKGMGPGIGRYPEDRYDGYTTNGQGNPWFLCTEAVAEILLRLNTELRSQREVRINVLTRPFYSGLVRRPLRVGMRFREGDPTYNEVLGALRSRSDEFLRRVRFHVGVDGHESEQFNRDHGEMQGARDLTWSYAGFLSLRRIREKNDELTRW